MVAALVTYGDTDEPAVPAQVAELQRQIDELHAAINVRRSQNHDTLEVHARSLHEIRQHIADLRESIEDLIHGGDDPAPDQPVVTERYLHKQTAKGWRLDETSVAIEWNGRTPDPELRMRALRDAYAAGEAEATIRNNAPAAAPAMELAS